MHQLAEYIKIFSLGQDDYSLVGLWNYYDDTLVCYLCNVHDAEEKYILFQKSDWLIRASLIEYC